MGRLLVVMGKRNSFLLLDYPIHLLIELKDHLLYLFLLPISQPFVPVYFDSQEVSFLLKHTVLCLELAALQFQLAVLMLQFLLLLLNLLEFGLEFLAVLPEENLVGRTGRDVDKVLEVLHVSEDSLIAFLSLLLVLVLK